MLDVSRENNRLRAEIDAALAEVCRSGAFVHGPACGQLETAVAEYCGAEHAVGCASGSDALLLALMVLGVGQGDEVILPSFTFFATAGAVWRLGAKPVFVDIDPATFNISPGEVIGKITKNTKAIIPVHLFGQCAAMDDLEQIAAAARNIPITDSAGTGVAENRMSGFVHVEGDASQSAGATGRGGLLRIDGNAASRCGISMKGIDIVVHGSIGHMSAFMAQSGNLVVLGDAGEALGDSLYEARLFVRGDVRSLGADCVEKEMRPEHLEILADLLAKAEADARPEEFRRYGSARTLYNFNIDNADAY